jgi:serine/threonine protein kinase
MGEVYRARDTGLARTVAVKVLPATVAIDGERLRRFEQEARAAAALIHPGILGVYDIGMHDKAPYIVMELLEGATLRDRLNTERLSVRKAVAYAGQVAEALAPRTRRGSSTAI